MFETLFDSADALARHRDGPFAEDRERFLEQRGQEGFSLGKLREYARMLLWIAGELDASPGRSLTVEQIRSAANRWWRRSRHEFRDLRHQRLAAERICSTVRLRPGEASNSPAIHNSIRAYSRSLPSENPSWPRCSKKRSRSSAKGPSR